MKKVLGEWWSSGFFDMEMAEVLFSTERIAQAKKEVAGIIRMTGLRKGSRVLDAACGIGRHSHEFTRRDFDVVGIDASEPYIRAARSLSPRERVSPSTTLGVLSKSRFHRDASKEVRGSKAEFHICDLRDLSLYHGQFDLVVNLFTSFGYYRRDKDNEKAIREMASCLKPGGKLVMELRCRESLENIFAKRTWQPLKTGFLLEEHQWIERGRRLRNTWTLLKGSSKRKFVFDLRVYEARELEALFLRAGLKKIRRMGNLAGAPWNQEKRTVMMGTK